MKYIPCKGKRVSNISEYEVKHGDNKGILAVCEGCVNVDLQRGHCQKCYGKVVMLMEEVFNIKKGDFETITTIVTDSFEIINGKVEKNEQATKLQKECFIIREIYLDESLQEDRSGFKLRGYDRPTNYKTACQECRNKCNNATQCKASGNVDFPNLCEKQKQSVKWV